MKFWDTSALVPLFVEEPETTSMRREASEDPDILVWMLTSVELVSSFSRLGRAAAGLDDLVPALRQEALTQFGRWHVVTHADGVRRRAERLVGVHPLSAADAMHLAAALIASGDRPEALGFVTLDRVLARAAQLEGFRVMGATERMR